MVKNSNLAKEFEFKNKSNQQSGWDSAGHLSTTLPPLIISSRRSQWLRDFRLQIFNTPLQYVTVDSLTNHMTNKSCCKKMSTTAKERRLAVYSEHDFTNPPSPPRPINS